MGLHEINPLLERIRELVVETHQLEGDGVDETAVAARRHELAQLKSLLATAVRHEPTHEYSAAA
jgi:hypothetical protein